MANSPQATKRAKQAQQKRLHNDSLESEMRTYIKEISSALEKNEIESAQAALKKAFIKIDRLAGNRVIHPNRGARLKSRLNKLVKKASESK